MSEGVEAKRVLIGDFFEYLTAHLFGGEVQENGENDSECGAPDIIHLERNQVYEVKATHRKDVHKIPPRQVDHYESLERQEFPLDRPEAYYFLWNYKPDVRIGRVKERDLERNLVKSEKSLMVCSLDVIKAGLKVWPTSCYPGAGEYHRVHSPVRRKFRKEPEELLEDLNLDSRRYKFDRFSLEGERYKRFKLPDFNITMLFNKKLRGVELVNVRN